MEHHLLQPKQAQVVQEARFRDQHDQIPKIEGKYTEPDERERCVERGKVRYRLG